MKSEKSRQVSEKIQRYKISWKSLQRQPSCYIRREGRTDMTRLMTAFRHFARAPKNRAPTWTTAAPETVLFCALLFCLNHLPVPYRIERLSASARPPITVSTRYASCNATTLATTSGNFMNNHYMTAVVKSSAPFCGTASPTTMLQV